MNPTPSLDPAQLVTRARAQLALSQRDFGSRVGRSQGLISKYEHGVVAPPAHVIIHCMHVLGGGVFSQSVKQEGWEAVHVALTQLQQALATVAPPSH